MVEAFGDYHRVFWNCQTFAKCFLQIICGKPATFDAWTLADATTLVCPHILFSSLFLIKLSRSHS